MCWSVFVFFFFKQKTAYEMRISDWSSDVCSSDLLVPMSRPATIADRRGDTGFIFGVNPAWRVMRYPPSSDRKSVVSGKSVSVRVDLGGRRIIKQKIILDHIK